MLTVGDIVAMTDLRLHVEAGAGGLDRRVTWLHVSELPDPTPFLEGGEFLLTTGLGIGDGADDRRAYVRRLAAHGLSGLGFGVGFGYADVPRALVEEAERADFPVLTVPYEVPFVAITKAAATELASEQLTQLTHALEVHERLAGAMLEDRGLDALLAIVCDHIDCSLAVADDSGRLLAERHGSEPQGFENSLELPLAFHSGTATLRAARPGDFTDYDRLVLHHGQTAVALELSRRHAVSAAELRLAGDLLEDLESDRLQDREAARRMAAFALEPDASYAALLAVSTDGGRASERLRRELATELDRRAVRHLSTARPDRAEFLVEAATETEAVDLARGLLEAARAARIAVGRPAKRAAIGRSLLEARAALGAGNGTISSFRDLGSLELLLGLPDPALQVFVDRVLGPASENERLLESLEALLEAGGRWSGAAATLGVHRHTLRYRMERLREETGRHPDDPEQRMELWLALKARQALRSRP